MRTKQPHILPGCEYCNADHDPAIWCRFRPVNSRGHLVSHTPRRREVQRITDARGNVIAVKAVYRKDEE
jgi:hypothetical protein